MGCRGKGNGNGNGNGGMAMEERSQGSGGVVCLKREGRRRSKRRKGEGIIG